MRVDVVMPLFRPRDVWLRAAVESVLAQTYEAWRLFLVDDGPADEGGLDLASTFVEEDPRIRVLRTSGQVGPGQARMLALAGSDGDAVAFLDQDDRWKPGKLAAQVARLDREPAVEAVVTGVDHIDGGGRIIAREGSGAAKNSPRWDSTRVDPATLKRMVFLRHDGVHMVSALIRRSVFDDVGGFSPGLRSGEDSEFWVRFVGAGYRFARLHEGWIERRIHDANTSRTAAWRAGHWEALEKILHEHPDLVAVESERRRNLLCEDAMNYLVAGQGHKCRRTAARMLRLSVLDFRAWALLMLSASPSVGAAVLRPRLR